MAKLLKIDSRSLLQEFKTESWYFTFFRCQRLYPIVYIMNSNIYVINILFDSHTLNMTEQLIIIGFPGGSGGKKKSACNSGDLGWIPGLGRSPGEGHGNPLQYSCLENPHGQRSLVGESP